MNTSMKISKNTVIIGGGAWGTAIAHQLRLGAAQIGAAQNSTLLVRASSTVHALEKGHIRQHPEIKGLSGFNATTDLTCLKEAEIVYLVVPVAAHAEMLERIKSGTKQNCAIVLCAKGLMPDTEKGGIFLHEYIKYDILYVLCTCFEIIRGIKRVDEVFGVQSNRENGKNRLLCRS